MKNNLLIACKHIINKTRDGFWSVDQEVILCKPCWDRINKLEEKYQGKIPIEKLDFVASYCQDCIDKILADKKVKVDDDETKK